MEVVPDSVSSVRGQAIRSPLGPSVTLSVTDGCGMKASLDRLSADCQSFVEIRWENRAATVGFLVVDLGKWLRGRDLNPRPLGYEPVQIGQPAASAGYSRPKSLMYLATLGDWDRPAPTTHCQPFVSGTNRLGGR
jgi:hypothetical protein